MAENEKKSELRPRDYQVQMVEIAMKKNTIIFLPTGSGKTFIAVLLLKQMGECLLRSPGDGKKNSILLVNTVALVHQHKETLKKLTPYEIGAYTGDLNVDCWDKEMWRKEMIENHVLIMTAQIFCNNLEHGFMKLSMVNLIIFDECHHAVSNHPMRQIMRNFEDVPEDKTPRVLGLTATLLNSNCKPHRVMDEVKDLEVTYQANVATVDSLDQVISFSTNPKEMLVAFNTHSTSDFEDQLIKELNNLWELVRNLKAKFKDSATKTEVKNGMRVVNKESNELKKMISDTTKHLKEQLGIYGTYRAVQSQMIKLECLRLSCENSEMQTILLLIYTKYLTIRKNLENLMRNCSELEKIMKFSSSKVLKLIQILIDNIDHYGTEICCIIFVQERFTAKCVYYILDTLKKWHTKFRNTKPDFICGMSSNPMIVSREILYNAKMYKKIVQKFANKEVNILVASSVVEEGIDIPNCKLVIKFDHPISYRSYIQSKGRARHDTSRYVIMIQNTNKDSFQKNYSQYIEIENILVNLLMGKSNERPSPTEQEIQQYLYGDVELESYCVEGNESVKVTMVSAISLLCRYCQTLYTDRYTVYNVIWYMNTIDLEPSKKLYQCCIELPVTCPITDIIEGKPMLNVKLAKCSAALEGCKLLHRIGELNNNLLPRQRMESVEEDSKFLFKHYPTEKDPGTGTKKKRRIHNVKVPDQLHGQIVPLHTAYLHLIVLKPQFINKENHLSYNVLNDSYKSSLHYGLLTVQALPQVCDFPLFTTQGQVTVSFVYNYKTLKLTVEELKDIREFHHLVFNDVLRLVQSFVVLNNEKNADMMLVVPIQNSEIDFDIVRNFKDIENVDEPHDLEKTKLIVTKNTHEKKIVCPWYRRETFYVVTRVCEELSANSEFPSKDYDSYVAYYREKYGISIKQPKLPLLLVKALSRRFNYLKPRGHGGKRRKLDMYEEMEEHLIPELCTVFSFPSPLWIQASLLPSILHKVMQFMRIDNLRRRIAIECKLGIPKISDNDNWEMQSIDSHTLKEQIELKPKVKDKTRNMDDDNSYKMNSLNVSQSSIENIIDENIKTVNEEFMNRRLESQYPWKDNEEPVDIFKNIDDITELDIIDYVNFISHEVDFEEIASRQQLKYDASISYPAITFPREYKESKIHILEQTSNHRGVELKNIYQAFATAKANDIVNLERYETLGDSFLKYAVSMFTLQRFMNYDEGKLTALKGKLVSNKNLFYLALHKELQIYILDSDFSPDSHWLPPGYVIPTSVIKRIDNKEMPINSLFHIDIPSKDQSAGIFHADSMEEDDILDDPDDEGMCIFRGQQVLSDKTVADSVESLIGVYLEQFGCEGAIKILNWLEVLPDFNYHNDITMHKNVQPKDIDYFITNYKILEENLGYTFKNRAYLLQALTHASYTPNRITNCYQRLEFLGDAILDFLITCYIYENCGNLTPGELTDLRSALVNNITFGAFTVRCEFQKHLLTLNHTLMDMIGNFVQFQEQRNFAINEEILILLEENDVYIAEYIDVPKVLGDLFEALAGAVYLDSGRDLKTVWRVFYKIMWREIDMFSSNVPKNLVRLLFETKGAYPKFLKPKQSESNTTMVSLEFMLNGEKKLVHGFGDTKHAAKKAAAKIALRLMSISNTVESH